MPGMVPKKKSPDEIGEEFERLREQHNKSLASWLKAHSHNDDDDDELKCTAQAVQSLHF